MTTGSRQKAILAYEVLPSRFQRLQLVFGKRAKEHGHFLGFLGLSGTVRSRKLLIESSKFFDPKAQATKVQLLKFPGNIVIAQIELEASYLPSQWVALLKPHTAEFSNLAIWAQELPFKAIYSNSSVVLINPTGLNLSPELLCVCSERDFVAENLALRIALTAAVEKTIVQRVNHLNFKSRNFSVVNGLLSIVLNWPEIWNTSSFSAQQAIDSMDAKLGSKAQVQDLVARLKTALNNEQRRIAWAAGSGVAIANLLVQTLPGCTKSWLPWVALAVISIAIYIWKPFSK